MSPRPERSHAAAAFIGSALLHAGAVAALLTHGGGAVAPDVPVAEVEVVWMSREASHAPVPAGTPAGPAISADAGAEAGTAPEAAPAPAPPPAVVSAQMRPVRLPHPPPRRPAAVHDMPAPALAANGTSKAPSEAPMPAAASAADTLPAERAAPAGAAAPVVNGEPAGSAAPAFSVVAHVAPAYPPGARRRGSQGRVVVGVAIDAEGRPERTWIAARSPDPELDAAARAAVARWRFASGAPARIEIPIVFRLRDHAAIQLSSVRDADPAGAEQ